jgi:hypothetical protein
MDQEMLIVIRTDDGRSCEWAVTASDETSLDRCMLNLKRKFNMDQEMSMVQRTDDGRCCLRIGGDSL